MALTGVWNGVPALYHGAPTSAAIWTVASYRNFPSVRTVWTGLAAMGNGKTEAMSHRQAILSFLIGMGTEQPTMWVSWRNVRMVLFIPWRVTLAMPVNRISILSAAALFMVMVYLPTKKRTAHYGLFYTYHFRRMDFVDFTISMMAFNSLSLQSERI